MIKKSRTIVATLLVASACVAVGVSQASAATIEARESPFLALYGSPPGSSPIGGGLARNFGFGESLRFEASATSPAEQLEFTLSGVVYKWELILGAVLTSNRTGENHPLGMAINFADAQQGSVGGSSVPLYSDTADRPWIAQICSPASTTCKVDSLANAGTAEVKIENVSFDLGPGAVIQGTLWGTWVNGTATTPPCIRLNLPPASAAADQTLVVTKSSTFTVGTKITAIKGEACLVGANNDYYPGNTAAISIANK